MEDRDRRQPFRVAALRALAMAGALALSLTGCSIMPAFTTPQAPDAASPSGGTADDADAGDDARAALTGLECVVGSWLLDNGTFAELMSLEGRVVDSITGTVRFRADADGEAVTEYADWTHVIRMTEQDAVVTLVRNGSDTGTLTEEADGTLSLLETVNDSEIVSVMEMGGKRITVPTVKNSPGALHLAVFDCSGDELTLTVDGRSTVMSRES